MGVDTTLGGAAVREDSNVTDPLDLPVPWWRNRDGTKVHRVSCRHAAVPWVYARDFTEERLGHFTATVFYVSLCRGCFAEGSVARKEERRWQG